MLEAIKQETGRPLHLDYAQVRPGDQPLYISDTGKIQRDTGWRPRCSLADIRGSIRAFWDRNEAAIRQQQAFAHAAAVNAQEAMLVEEVA